MKNPYISEIKELIEQWDYDKNKLLNLDPSKITTGSNKKVWWKCIKFSHSYERSIVSKNTKSKIGDKYTCPVCSGQIVLIGFNDLVSNRPDLAKDWDYKNNLKLPEEYTVNSGLKVWWVCSQKGHSYFSRIDKRNIFNRGCPYCTNQKILSGFNDLKTRYPEAASKWDYKRNFTVPEMHFPSSRKQMWWICEKNHSYRASIRSIALRDSICTKCNYQTSRQEIDLYNKLCKKFPTLEIHHRNRSVIKSIRYVELDIYIKEVKLAVEYNGIYWHDKKAWLKDLKNNTFKTKENLKSKLCQEKGITLIHIWEDDCNENLENELSKLYDIIDSRLSKIRKI